MENAHHIKLMSIFCANNNAGFNIIFIEFYLELKLFEVYNNMFYSSCYNKKEIDGDGTLFIASILPKKIKESYKHIKNLDDDIHMTILYLEEGINTSEDREKVLEVVKKVCKEFQPIKCQLTEIGIMDNEENTMVANVTVMNGAEFYSKLLNSIQNKLNIKLKRKYDFLPHVSLKFKNKSKKTVNIKDLRNFKWTINNVDVSFGEDCKAIKVKIGK